MNLKFSKYWTVLKCWSKVDLCHVIISCGIKLCNIFFIVLLNKLTMPSTFIFWNNFAHWKPLTAFLIWSTFGFLKHHTSCSYGGGKATLRLNFAKTIWWWQFWCKEDWTPDSTTKFGCEAKIKSMQEDLSPIIWFGSWISCYSPNWDVIPSILVPH